MEWRGTFWTVIIVVGIIWAALHLTGCSDYIVRCGLNRSYCN